MSQSFQSPYSTHLNQYSHQFAASGIEAATETQRLIDLGLVSPKREKTVKEVGFEPSHRPGMNTPNWRHIVVLGCRNITDKFLYHISDTWLRSL